MEFRPWFVVVVVFYVPTVRLEKIAATELLEHALSDDFFEISNKIAYDRALTFFSVVS